MILASLLIILPCRLHTGRAAATPEVRRCIVKCVQQGWLVGELRRLATMTLGVGCKDYLCPRGAWDGLFRITSFSRRICCVSLTKSVWQEHLGALHGDTPPSAQGCCVWDGPALGNAPVIAARRTCYADCKGESSTLTCTRSSHAHRPVPGARHTWLTLPLEQSPQDGGGLRAVYVSTGVSLNIVFMTPHNPALQWRFRDLRPSRFIRLGYITDPSLALQHGLRRVSVLPWY